MPTGQTTKKTTAKTTRAAKTTKTATKSTKALEKNHDADIKALQQRCAKLEKANAELLKLINSKNTSASNDSQSKNFKEQPVTQKQWRDLKQALKDCQNLGMVAGKI